MCQIIVANQERCGRNLCRHSWISLSLKCNNCTVVVKMGLVYYSFGKNLRKCARAHMWRRLFIGYKLSLSGFDDWINAIWSIKHLKIDSKDHFMYIYYIADTDIRYFNCTHSTRKMMIDANRATETKKAHVMTWVQNMNEIIRKIQNNNNNREQSTKFYPISIFH